MTMNTAVQWTASLAWWLRRLPREQKIPGSNPVCTRIFLGSSHTSDLETGMAVATLPGAWRYRVSAGTGTASSISVWQHVKLSEQIRH